MKLGNEGFHMVFKATLHPFFILFFLLLMYTQFSPIIVDSSASEVELNRVVFAIHDNLDFRVSTEYSYHNSLPLTWVGSHARVYVQGGVITGLTPSKLTIFAFLDGIATSQTFVKTNGLLKYHTFHTSDEYVFEVPPPVRPALEEIPTLHNFTVSLNFTFNTAPDGTGFLKRIIFETFTPPGILLTQIQPLVVIQDQFNWQVSQWSFGRCFFNSSVITPIEMPHNLSLSTTAEFNGVTLESWQLALEQGSTRLTNRNTLTLEGVMLIDPVFPLELSVTVDPPQVSTSEIISVSVNVIALALPLPDPIDPQSEAIDRLTEKRFNEGLILVQLGLVVVPLLTYYRVQRPKFSFSTQENR